MIGPHVKVDDYSDVPQSILNLDKYFSPENKVEVAKKVSMLRKGYTGRHRDDSGRQERAEGRREEAVAAYRANKNKAPGRYEVLRESIVKGLNHLRDLKSKDNPRVPGAKINVQKGRESSLTP